LPLLTKTEQRQLLVEWNHTQTEYPQDQCIHQLFEAQVEKTPDAVALVFEAQQLTYRQLNHKANQLAHYLLSLGVKPEVLVGICIERSLEMVIGLLGILKAGGAYLPLDPTYPAARLAFMLEDAQVPVLLTQSSLKKGLPKTTAQVLCLDVEAETLSELSMENIASQVAPENLAYVIYTSGSTGKPKGVQIQHQSLTNFLLSLRQTPGLSEQDTLLAITTISFDIAALELYLPLIVGAKIVLVSREVAADGLQLLAKLNQAGITVMQATPATWRLLLAAGWKSSNHLKIFIGGEALPKELANQFFNKSQVVWNLYGPTETTIWSSVFQVGVQEAIQTKGGLESIGHPIANTQIYLLDQYLQPVPIGVSGELHIGGAGLARGYLNRPELTAEKFIQNPFGDDSDDRLYKTGDLARYLPDGNIEYLNRIDNHVKIRGFRIELGEIEAVLVQHPEVHEAVVIIREVQPGDKRLIAYLVPIKAQEVMPSTLRQFLKEKLPDYMVPSAFVELEAMPLTPNGKIDRRALPAPDHFRTEAEEKFVAPRDALELQLTKIWEEVLGVHPIGVKDNFFALGGHSLLIIRLLTKIERSIGKNLPVATVFQAPTVEQLTNILRQEGCFLPNSSLAIIQPASGGRRPPLFFIQVLGKGLEYCLPLARHIGADQPIYGLSTGIMDRKQAQLIKGGKEELNHYLKQMRTIQPEGPYFLAGIYCGGRTAFEVAQLLHKQGQKVALLALIDTRVVFAQGTLKPTITLRKRFSAHWNQFLQVGFAYVLNKGKKRFKRFTKRFIRIYQKMACKFYDRLGYPLPPTLQDFAIEEAARTTFTYLPQKYPGRVTFFRAINTSVFDDPIIGWHNVAENGLEVHDIPGDTPSMLQEPHVQVLAKELRACIDKNLVANDAANC
jgi:aspartate racemase